MYADPKHQGQHGYLYNIRIKCKIGCLETHSIKKIKKDKIYQLSFYKKTLRKLLIKVNAL